MKKIASKVITASEQLTGVLEDKSLPRNFDCIEDTVKLFSERCFNINKVLDNRQVYFTNIVWAMGREIYNLGEKCMQCY